MGEAKNIYFTCLKFVKVLIFPVNDDALFPRAREPGEGGEGARRQPARALQEHARGRKGHQGYAPQTRHQVPQERLRAQGDRALQTLRWRTRTSCSGQSLERFWQPRTLAQKVRRILPLSAEERGIQRGVQRPRRGPSRRRPRPSQPRRADEAQNVPRPRQNQRLHVLPLPYRSYSHGEGRHQGKGSGGRGACEEEAVDQEVEAPKDEGAARWRHVNWLEHRQKRTLPFVSPFQTKIIENGMLKTGAVSFFKGGVSPVVSLGNSLARKFSCFGKDVNQFLDD